MQKILSLSMEKMEERFEQKMCRIEFTLLTSFLKYGSRSASGHVGQHFSGSSRSARNQLAPLPSLVAKLTVFFCSCWREKIFDYYD